MSRESQKFPLSFIFPVFREFHQSISQRPGPGKETRPFDHEQQFLPGPRRSGGLCESDLTVFGFCCDGKSISFKVTPIGEFGPNRPRVKLSSRRLGMSNSERACRYVAPGRHASGTVTASGKSCFCFDSDILVFSDFFVTRNRDRKRSGFLRVGTTPRFYPFRDAFAIAPCQSLRSLVLPLRNPSPPSPEINSERRSHAELSLFSAVRTEQCELIRRWSSSRSATAARLLGKVTRDDFVHHQTLESSFVFEVTVQRGCRDSRGRAGDGIQINAPMPGKCMPQKTACNRSSRMCPG